MTKVYKIWDIKHKRFTINQGRPSRNKHHPGRVYMHADDVKSCLKLCDSFWGDLDNKRVFEYELPKPIIRDPRMWMDEI